METNPNKQATFASAPVGGGGGGEPAPKKRSTTAAQVRPGGAGAGGLVRAGPVHAPAQLCSCGVWSVRRARHSPPVLPPRSLQGGKAKEAKKAKA